VEPVGPAPSRIADGVRRVCAYCEGEVFDMTDFEDDGDHAPCSAALRRIDRGLSGANRRVMGWGNVPW
jgi:hypothetical protein